MKLFGRIVNPLVAFVGIQLAWVLVVIFWIYWFMGLHRELRTLAERYSPELARGGADWFILAEGLVLLAAILAGVYVIFLYWNRQAALYQAQRNFVSQVTHELKSPLASLQLHLETIRLRHPTPEQMEGFLETMLADTDRLNGLIENLLSASRFEQRGVRLMLRPTDLSELVESYFRERERTLPPGARLRLDVAPGLRARVDRESLEIALRNLLENAVLYAEGPPDVEIRLREDGRDAHLTVSDRGRGIEPRHLKKIFRLFYRVRRAGESIRGSGLGLFIVRTAIRRHHGRVWSESGGPGHGATFHVVLPRIEPGPREEKR